MPSNRYPSLYCIGLTYIRQLRDSTCIATDGY